VKEVRDAVRNLQSALEGIEAAERATAAAQEQLRAEKIRLEHGESTPFDVLQREEDLVTSESQRIGALRVYHGSVTALDRAQGTLLEDRGIVLDEALRLR
jgi:outer membrane protein TolC